MTRLKSGDVLHLVILITIALLVWPGSAFALSLGVNDSPEFLSSSDYARIDNKLGPRIVRLGVGWNKIQPTKNGGYDWTHIDRAVASSARNGYRLVLNPRYAPGWAIERSGCDTRGWSPAPHNFDRFVTFVRDAMQRYGREGGFWRNRPNLPYLPVMHWEPWSEPNSHWRSTDGDCSKDWSVHEFADLQRQSYRGIKSEDSRAHVLLGGPSNRSERSKHYVEDLFTKPDVEVTRYYDIASLHPYGADPDAVRRNVKQFRSIPGAVDGKPLWITEVGWGTGSRRQLTVSENAQRAYLDQLLDWLCGNHLAARFFWHRALDPVAADGSKWGNHAGLGRQDRTWKPAADRFEKGC